MPDWTDRLNATTTRLSIGGGRVEVVVWAHEPHLVDNQPHRHTYFEACLVGDHGRGRFIAQGEEHDLRPGTFFLARPGIVHQIRNVETQLMELLWVSFSWVPGDGPPRNDAERQVEAMIASPAEVAADAGRLRSIWDALRAVSLDGIPEQTRARGTALLLEMSLLLAPREAPPAVLPSDLAVRLAIRYINDNLGRPLTLEEIAAHVHLSPRHLTRQFAAFAGVPPLRYAMTARLDRASALLSSTLRPIKEIAESVGFPDVHHFTRCFARHFGVPPAAFRRGERSGCIAQNPGALV